MLTSSHAEVAASETWRHGMNSAYRSAVDRSLQRARRMQQMLLTAGLIAVPVAAPAAIYNYVDWTSANVAGGTATGVITLPDLSTVTVNFAAINPNGSPGNL